jgi:PAS domain S-box-containing protein
MSATLLNGEGRTSSLAAPDDLEDFFENGAIGLHIVDGRGIILRANKAELDLLGYTAEEYVGRCVADFHADAQAIDDILCRLGAGDRLDKYPARLRAKDGSIKHVQISSSVRFEGGQFINTRCFTVDVTAAKEAEAARLEAERRLVNTYESVTVGIGETDPAGRFTRVNAAFTAITGYSRDELLDMNFELLTHPDDRAEDLALYRDQMAGGRERYTLEKRYVRKDGEVIHVEVQSSTVRGPDGAFLYGVRVVSDITARRRAEQLLQDSERRSRELLDALPTAVYTTDRHGKITYCNEAAVALAGRRPRLGADEWCVTWKLYCADGTPLPHEECPMALTLKSGEALRGVEAVAERPDGSLVTMMPHPSLLRDRHGEVVGAINVLVDISERKRADEAQKLLIDELNHRVKNTLAVVQSIAMHTQRSSPQTFAEKFEERLLGLSRAHDLLTRRRWAGVGLGELLEQTLAPVADDIGSRILLDGPELTLPARIGLALSMAVHELATNAAKHGALASAAGLVRATWRIEEDGRTLALEWRETGGPPARAPTRRGFGLRLIERNVTKDLGGGLDLRFEPHGLQAAFSFPLS